MEIEAIRRRAEQDGDESEYYASLKPSRGKKRLELHAQWIDAKCREIDNGIAFLESQEEGIMADIMAEMCRDHKSCRLADERRS